MHAGPIWQPSIWKQKVDGLGRQLLSVCFVENECRVACIGPCYAPCVHTHYKHIRAHTQPHQSLDASILSHGPPGSPELGHIGDGFGRQALEVLVWGVEDLHHGLQAPQVSDRPPDLRVTTDLLQDLQRANLI